MADNSVKKGRHTKYSNKVGLFSNTKGSFIKNDTEVVLSFPFKDTVLEAGMSKEDTGREERFLHQELDSKDIDTLEEPKVLTGFSYIDKDGEKPLTSDSEIEFFDSEGDLKQNLLIKGNNLLALYTLREKLAGKVKLIYIDPPYNTGGDGFKYNDKFNHSAWLAFIKNRLEVAKELLRSDGSIFVHCDDSEQAYLRVLMDEIYGRDNFVGTIVWERAYSPVNLKKHLSVSHDYIHCYASNLEELANFRDVRSPEALDRYKNPDNDPRGTYKLGDFSVGPAIQKNIYEITTPSGRKVLPPSGYSWRYSEERTQELIADNRVWFGAEGNNVPSIKRFLSEVQDGVVPMSIWKYAEVGHSQDATQGLKKLFDGESVFSNPKTEGIMKRIIQIASNEGDLVLDFMLGSGTTSAVAHKMNRRWVGVEQMDYVEHVAKERLKKVLSGELGGISKSVGWRGGGSFVYFELKKYNQEYVDNIMKATSLSELEDLYVDMRNNAFLKFWFDRNEFEKDENFRKLDIEQRKRKLIDVLDENQLYLNYADMNDTRHNVSSDEKILTDKFYGTAEN